MPCQFAVLSGSGDSQPLPVKLRVDGQRIIISGTGTARSIECIVPCVLKTDAGIGPRAWHARPRFVCRLRPRDRPRWADDGREGIGGPGMHDLLTLFGPFDGGAGV